MYDQVLDDFWPESSIYQRPAGNAPSAEPDETEVDEIHEVDEMDEVDIENQLPEYDNDITEVKAENITR